jgi:hypothetical protein
MTEDGSETKATTVPPRHDGASERDLVVEAPLLPLTRRDELTGAERREHPRLPLGLWAHCQIDGVVSQEALGDLSIGGLYLRTTTAAGLGARVRIVLGLPYIGGQRVCSLSGHVVWVDKDGANVRGLGVKFDQETDSADKMLLRGFLSLWGMPRSAASGPEVGFAEAEPAAK